MKYMGSKNRIAKEILPIIFFICVWQKDLTTSFSTSESIKATEKLFIFNDIF